MSTLNDFGKKVLPEIKGWKPKSSHIYCPKPTSQVQVILDYVNSYVEDLEKSNALMKSRMEKIESLADWALRHCNVGIPMLQKVTQIKSLAKASSHPIRVMGKIGENAKYETNI